MKLSNADIKAFCEKVATDQTLIGHVAADKKRQRFYGFNHQELLDAERSKLDFRTLVMGLGLPGSVNVTWNYKNTGTAPSKNKYFDLAVLGKFSDYQEEDIKCSEAEFVLDQLLAWLFEKTNHPNGCDYPIVEKMDVDNIQCRRLQDIGIAELCGAVMRVPLRDYIIYGEDGVFDPLPPESMWPIAENSIPIFVDGAWTYTPASSLQGPPGADGADGADGAQGPAGATGPQGTAGADGLDGAPGADGATGPQGPQGPAGADGADGATGPQGPAGPTAKSADAGNLLTLGTDALLYFKYLATEFGSFINGLTSKSTPVDADELVLMDSADSNNAKKLSWADLKAALNSNYGYRQIITDHASYQLTGTTVETLMLAVLIPGGTVSANKSLEVCWRVIRSSGTSGSIIPRIRVATTAAPSPVTSATQLALGTAMGTTNFWQQLKRTFVYKSSTSTTMFLSTGQSTTDDVTSTGAQSSVNIDWTVNQYLLFTLINSNAGDVSSLEHVDIYLLG